MKMVKIVSFGLVYTMCVSSQVHAMDDSIKKQIERADRDLASTQVEYLSREEQDSYAEYNRTLATIVHTAGNRMSNQEKLNLLYGDPRWDDRKEVIKKMILDDRIDPNAIEYRGYTPMKESVGYHDTEFTAYLEKHGAKPMTDQEKLGHIYDWQNRKKIIQKMITVDHIDPNMIQYTCSTTHSHKNLLYECYVKEDVVFARYLLQRGAAYEKMTFKNNAQKSLVTEWILSLLPLQDSFSAIQQPTKQNAQINETTNSSVVITPSCTTSSSLSHNEEACERFNGTIWPDKKKIELADKGRKALLDLDHFDICGSFPIEFEYSRLNYNYAALARIAIATGEFPPMPDKNSPLLCDHGVSESMQPASPVAEVNVPYKPASATTITEMHFNVLDIRYGIRSLNPSVVKLFLEKRTEALTADEYKELVACFKEKESEVRRIMVDLEASKMKGEYNAMLNNEIPKLSAISKMIFEASQKKVT